MSNIDGNAHSKFNAWLRGIQLADVNRALKSSAMPKNVALGGVLNAEANAAWGKTFDDVVAHADATVQGRVTGTGNGAPRLFPWRARSTEPIPAAIRSWRSSRASCARRKARLTMNGVVSQRSSLDLKFQSNNLSELETVADLFRTPAPGQPVQPLGACRDGVVSGHSARIDQRPPSDGTVDRFQLPASTEPDWRVLRTNVDRKPIDG